VIATFAMMTISLVLLLLLLLLLLGPVIDESCSNEVQNFVGIFHDKSKSSGPEGNRPNMISHG
jgi:hypothetical protein